MKAIANPFLRMAAGLALLGALGSCIQGPWDYYPENPKPFRGIWLTGYAIAGQPIRQVCMERLLDVAEEYTNAFPFYDSAMVTVFGRFGDSTGTVRLTPLENAPNCFRGDSTVLVRRGGDYALEARVTWDSAGTRVTSVLKAVAQVPDSFSIRRTAAASSMVLSGGSPSNIFTPEFFLTLPPTVQEVLIKEYGDTLIKLQPDSAALRAYLAANGAKIQARLVQLLEKERKHVYKEGDTLFYLGGVLNTSQHYYTSDRSEDVAGVLITHRFDPESERPETAFQGIFGTEPDTSDFYYEGTTRRLGLWPAAMSPDGYALLDSIGVVNLWFHTRRNRLYFYGVEDAYVDYVNTAIMSNGDPRIKIQNNVEGGRGIFIGAVPDSFDVYIKVDSTTKAYSLPVAHVYECREDGWFNEKDCSDYYRTWCQSREWKDQDCRVDALRANLEAALKSDTLLDLATDSAATEARNDTSLARQGVTRFCVENNYPDLGETCDAASRDCVANAGINSCKETLWRYCKESLWVPTQCKPALVWYCRDKPRASEVMCRRADEYCRDNPGWPACR